MPPLLMNVFGAGLAVSTAARLGWFYTLAFHRVALDVAGSGGSGVVLRIGVRISLAFMLGTALAAWLLFRAGRAVARRPEAQRAGGGITRRALLGATIAPAYAIPIFALTTIVRLRLGSSQLPPFAVRVEGVAWQAFVLPFALAALAGAAGSALEVLPVGSRIRAALVGGWTMFLAALVLATAGVLILAALRPSGLATYVHGISANGPRVAALLLGHQALLLPNQALMVLAPSMSTCTLLQGPRLALPILCAGRLPAFQPSAFPAALGNLLNGATGGIGGIVRSRPVPLAYSAFLLVPMVATVSGGWVAARGADGRPPALVAALAGVVFGVLAGIGAWFASVALRADPQQGGTAVVYTLGPRPLSTLLVATSWGVLGGLAGALLARRQGVVPLAPPPSPTSV
ncbi:MAG: hypothetical protein ACXVPR_02810 [Actinomycetota bacterium]